MKYEIPENITGSRLYKSPPIIIEPEDEDIVEVSLRVAYAAINQAPIRNGMGVFDPRIDEWTITEDDITSLRDTIQQDNRVVIDYWKGQPVKLRLVIDEGVIILYTGYWMDRWNNSGWGGVVLDFVVDTLQNVLNEATAIEEVVPLEKGLYI